MLDIKQLETLLPRENMKVKLYTMHNYSEIWKGIRYLVNIKSLTNKNINLLDNNNNDLLNNSLEIANRFNDYFSTIGSSIEKKR